MTSMIVSVANARRISAEVFAAVMMPPPPVDYLSWAERNIVFSERESPLPGPYNRDLFFYFDEILRALSPSDPCRIVTLKSRRSLAGPFLPTFFAAARWIWIRATFFTSIRPIPMRNAGRR